MGRRLDGVLAVAWMSTTKLELTELSGDSLNEELFHRYGNQDQCPDRSDVGKSVPVDKEREEEQHPHQQERSEEQHGAEHRRALSKLARHGKRHLRIDKQEDLQV